MDTFATLIDSYIALWNETNADARLALAESVWAPDGRYVDPLLAAHGPAAISAGVGAVQSQFPGWVFRLAAPIDAHHDQARFQWELGPAGAEPQAVGFDVAVRDEVGRLQLVLGFLDRVPPADDTPAHDTTDRHHRMTTVRAPTPPRMLSPGRRAGQVTGASWSSGTGSGWWRVEAASESLILSAGSRANSASTAATMKAT
jgi:SnoaL-like protein